MHVPPDTSPQSSSSTSVMRDKIRPPAACGRNLLIMPENRLSHATYDTLCAGRRQFVSTQAVSSTVRSSRPTPTIPLSNGLPPSDRCLFCRMLISEHSSWLILRQGSDAIMFRKNHPCRFHREIRYNAHDHRRQSCGCTTRPKRTRTKSARAWIVQTIEVRQLSAIDYLSADFAASSTWMCG
jgi:hypothetical protein